MSIERNAPTRRVRKIADSGSRDSVEHVGLAHEKLAPHQSDQDKERKSRFIRNLAEHSGTPKIYEAAFKRWVRRTLELRGQPWGRRVAVAVSQGRVLCGLGEVTPTENGLSVHHTYGVPYLPGSSLKGIAKAWLRESVHDGPWSDGGALFNDVFGVPPRDEDEADDGSGSSGVVSFLDALWIPGDPNLPSRPFAAEILTPHFSEYYGDRDGRTAPDGTQSPIPVTFLAAQGGFRLVIEGPDPLLDELMEVLTRALLERGVGAKSRSGYGRFTCDRTARTREDERAIEEQRQREQAAAAEQRYARAISAAAVLALLREDDPKRDIAADFVQWATGRPETDSRLAPFAPDHAALPEAYAWLGQQQLAKGVVAQLRDRIAPELLDLLLDAARPSATAATPRPGGTTHLDSFEPVPLIYGKKSKNWPNDFAQFIIKGNFDEDTVRRAIDYLLANGGKPGHVKTIRGHYGLEDS